MKDNHFTELKEMEILRERVGLMNEVTQYVGEYFSKDWVMRNVLQLSEDDMKDMKKDIAKEISDDEIVDRSPGAEDEKEEPAPKAPKAPAPTAPVAAPKAPVKKDIDTAQEK